MYSVKKRILRLKNKKRRFSLKVTFITITLFFIMFNTMFFITLSLFGYFHTVLTGGIF